MASSAVTWPWPWQVCRWRRLLKSKNKRLRREAWGYAFWLPLVFLVFLPAELLPVWWKEAGWPTFSTTIGHLEYHLWGPIALAVVGLMVFTGVNAYARKQRQADARSKQRRGETRGLYRDDADGGRIVGRPSAVPKPLERHLRTLRLMPEPSAPVEDTDIPWWPYFALGVALIASAYFVFRPLGYWPGAYALWTAVALVVLVVPSILAWKSKHVPFPTLFRTAANLQDRYQMIGTLLLAFIVGLGVHLSLYPWPNIAHVLKADEKINPTITGDDVKGERVTVSGSVENCSRPQKVVIHSRVFAGDGTAGAGELTVSVDKNGHFAKKVTLTATPTDRDTVEVYCGRPLVGSTTFK